MKGIPAYILILALMFTCTKSDDQGYKNDDADHNQKPVISMEGRLFHQIYTDPSKPTEEQSAYMIYLNIRNTGEIPVRFTDLEAIFRAVSGDSIRLLLQPGEAKEDYNNSEIVIIELEPGESAVVPGISTDGHTEKLVSSQKDDSLFLSIRLFFLEKLVLDSFTASLPNLEELKKISYHTGIIQVEDTVGLKLQF